MNSIVEQGSCEVRKLKSVFVRFNMDFIMEELLDDLDEMELVEFGVPRATYTRLNHYNDMPEYKFHKKFRLTKDTVMFLLPLLEEQLEFPLDINQCVSPMNQLLTTLRFYATGSHVDSIADFIGMHETTALRIIHKVSRAIASLYQQFVYLPDTEEAIARVKRDFHGIARFPNVIGALDCTHIKIQSPGGEDPEIYRNRKDYFSINVQGICDANNNFLNVVARWPGATHDSTIFNNSAVKTYFEEAHFPQCVLLGDRGYPLKNYLLTPFPNPNTPAQQLYNQAHIRTRNKIECSFGILKRRFPVLAYGCRFKVENVLPVIVACVVLHNIAKMHNEPEPAVEDGMDPAVLEQLIEDGHIIPQQGNNNDFLGGYNYRTQLVNEYFARL